ncbi:MAG: (Fe-S)-binding protein [Pseudomonadota bacterium]
MADFIVFPDHESFQAALRVLPQVKCSAEQIEPPEFCAGLTAPFLLVASGRESLLSHFSRMRVPVSGTIPYLPFRKENPDAAAPDAVWRDVLGGIRVDLVRAALTDPNRLRIEISFYSDVAYLIPIMARLIRGGAFRPDVPVLAFEEEHRLVVITRNGMVISRADDLLDFRIILRTAVDFFLQAFDLRFTVAPAVESRHGLGAMEIFKRLPGIDCRECGLDGCMEFATTIITGRMRIQRCPPLLESNYAANLESLYWVLPIMGLEQAAAGEDLKGSPRHGLPRARE